MKLLVTGGAGYIGGTVAELLASRGDEPVIVDNLSHSRQAQIPAGIAFVEAEVSDRPRLERIFREAAESGRPFDGVLHFASLIEAGESMVRPGAFFRNNTAATLALLESMQACGVRKLVFSSTAAVYGEPERVPIEEGDKQEPTNAYGESKLLVERMLAWFHRIHSFRYAALRYFNVAGAVEGPEGVKRGEAHEPETHLIPLILDAALGRRESIKVFGSDYPTADGTCIRDYIHVADLAEAHRLAIHALDKQDRIVLNLGNGKGFSVKEVIESVRRVTGHKIPAEICPRRAGDPAVLVASSAKAAAELGWKPRYTELDEIVRTAWAWHQQRHGKNGVPAAACK